MQIHKYNYTNTQIQFGSNLQIDLTCAIFLKRLWYEDLKNNVPECVTSKYTNTTTLIHKYNYTNTQIQFASNLQIDLTCAIFLKRTLKTMFLSVGHANTQIQLGKGSKKRNIKKN